MGRLHLVAVDEAVTRIHDDDTLLIGGSGAGHAVPQLFIDRLATHFEAEGRPRDLTTVRVVGWATSPIGGSPSWLCPDS